MEDHQPNSSNATSARTARYEPGSLDVGVGDDGARGCGRLLIVDAARVVARVPGLTGLTVEASGVVERRGVSRRGAGTWPGVVRYHV